MKKNQVIGAFILLVVVAGGAFYGGEAYAKAQTPSRGAFAAGGFTAGGAGFAGRAGARGTARPGGGFTAGKIVSSANGSISIQQQNGSSTEIVLIGPSTQILKSIAGSAADLTVGTSVTVTGTSNSDGSLTAEAVQVRPAGMSPGR